MDWVLNLDKELRELTWERSKGYCEACGKPMDYETWDWSHRLSKSHGGKYEVQNGMAVHHACHLEEIENHPYLARQKGWRVASQGNPAEVPILLYGRKWVYLTTDGKYRLPIKGEKSVLDLIITKPYNSLQKERE